LNIAIGSISEIETQLLIAIDLGYLTEDASVFTLLEQVSKLVNGLWKSARL
jgi:four helix bundle protein